MEKNELGQWEVISNHARLGPINSTITNCSIGGSTLDYHSIYLAEQSKHISSYLPTDIKIRNTTLQIAKYIEKEFGHFGELGMDMAIDEKGTIWFLEANSKPNKNPIKGTVPSEGVIPQFLSILNYALYLSKAN